MTQAGGDGWRGSSSEAAEPESEDMRKRRKRASFLAWLAEGGLPDLTGPVGAEPVPPGTVG